MMVSGNVNAASICTSTYCSLLPVDEKRYVHSSVFLDCDQQKCYSSECANILTGKQELSMSLAGVISCNDGAVVFADTRNTVREGTGKITFRDDEHKFVLVPDTNIAMLHTGNNRFRNGTATIFDLAQSFQGKSKAEILQELFGIYWAEPSFKAYTSLISIEQCEKKGYTDVIAIERNTDNDGSLVQHHFTFGPGWHYQGVQWGVTLLGFSDVCAATVDESSYRIGAFIQSLHDFSESSLPHDQRTIGSKVDICKMYYYDHANNPIDIQLADE